MDKTTLGKISFAIAGLMTCGAAMAQALPTESSASATAPGAARVTFGSNLFVDPCTGCNYDPNSGGFDVRGPDNCTSPGSTTWLAVPFIASRTGVPQRISASLVL